MHSWLNSQNIWILWILTAVLVFGAMSAIAYKYRQKIRERAERSGITAAASGSFEALLGAHKYVLSPVIGAVVIFGIAWIIQRAWPDFTVKYRLQGGPSVWEVLVVFGIASVAALFVRSRTMGGGLAATIMATLFLWMAVSAVITWIHGADLSRGAIEEAQQKLQNEQNRQQAIAQAAARTPSGSISSMASGMVNGLFGTSPQQASCNVPRKPHDFTLEGDVLNPDPTRCTCSYTSLNGETFYVWQAGKTADADKIEVAANVSTKSYSFPNYVARIAAAYIPFTGLYDCH